MGDYDRYALDALGGRCPTCAALPGESCIGGAIHPTRTAATWVHRFHKRPTYTRAQLAAAIPLRQFDREEYFQLRSWLQEHGTILWERT